MRALWAVVMLSGCASVQTVRLQAETVDVGPNARPIAGIQATASSLYLFGIGIPGDLTLDRVVNRMLIAKAKEIGADKIANLTFTVECAAMCFSKIFGVLEARASGIAVQVTGPAPDADEAADPPPRQDAPR
jgi:hypothetical protein